MIKQLSFWADRVLSKPVVVLISGKAGTGKDAFAQTLCNKLMDIQYKVVIDHFAYSVKKAAIDYFSWDGQKDDKGRKLLQDIGRIGRDYKPVIWAESVLDRISNIDPSRLDVIIIPDWRFPNEKNYLVMTDLFQIITVRINAPEREVIDKESPLYFDVSEISLDTYDFDIEYYNTEDGIEHINEMCDNLITIYFKKE